MNIPVWNIPISVKALTAAVVAGVVNFLLNVVHLSVSDSVKGVIAAGVGLGVAVAIKEGVPYIDAWLKRYGIPVVLDEEP